MSLTNGSSSSKIDRIPCANRAGCEIDDSPYLTLRNPRFLAVFYKARRGRTGGSFVSQALIESELVVRAKEDPEAFGQLYERYVDKIFNYIYYRTGNHHDAEDLTARTFYQALKHVHRYVNRGVPFSAWLYRIAHNLVANWHRDRSRRQVIALDEIALTMPRQNPESDLESEDDQRLLMRLIRRMPDDRQQLLILKFVEQMSNQEIAQIMGRSEGAIKSLYHRTLLALREAWVSEKERMRRIDARSRSGE
jgi:RNA polymerase sigma-70 factor (ECF subfamily)